MLFCLFWLELFGGWMWILCRVCEFYLFVFFLRRNLNFVFLVSVLFLWWMLFNVIVCWVGLLWGLCVYWNMFFLFVLYMKFLKLCFVFYVILRNDMCFLRILVIYFRLSFWLIYGYIFEESYWFFVFFGDLLFFIIFFCFIVLECKLNYVVGCC